MERSRARRRFAAGPAPASTLAWSLATAAVTVLAAGAVTSAAQQTRAQQPPDLYHWVLPADSLGVEVATLHPNDCYVVSRATGVAFFGQPTAALRELQRQVGGAWAHEVEAEPRLPPEPHSECVRGACVDAERLAAAMEGDIATVSRRALRRVTHDPSPLDNFFGGAYSDVGTDGAGTDAAGLTVRARYRHTPEQQMIVRHLDTARRDNCYEAKLPRRLTIHVRDHDLERADRTGVYRGYLYIEHHHPEITGRAVVE